MAEKMHKAFTLIEIVFVIVILGILSAVVAPRFIGVTHSARLTKVQSFVDVLNRTVAPMMWSSIQRNVPTANGSVKHTDVLGIAKYSSIFDVDTANPINIKDAQMKAIPLEITTNADGVTGQGSTHDIPLSGCANAGTSINIGVGHIASSYIGNTVYNIGCIDGSLDISPHFFLDDGINILTK